MEKVRADKSINIKGAVCPYTFVRAKLAIEDMEVGQVLEIVLDYEAAARNIPMSMQEHGHEVLNVKKANRTDWVLHIRKGKD